MKKKNINIPIHVCKVEAGFPSPADNYIEEKLDIQKYLIKNSESTFLVKATGESMLNSGILPGDILVVDRSLEANDQSIVIVSIDGDLTVKRLIKDNNLKIIYLRSENPDYPDIQLNEHKDVMLWGVVTYSIHHLT
tara:strand:+ start:1753 stop:2160 length:408 start_codon:yes stop_codon:yes gene_type:complete